MKNLLIVLFFILNLNNTFGANKAKCEYPIKELGLCMYPHFMEGISRKSDSKFELTFKSLSTNKLIQLTEQPSPKLWMVMKNGHEHGSEEVTVKKSTKGYTVENVWFLMQGEWKVFVDLKLGSKTAKTMFKVCVKRKKNESYLGQCN